MTLDRLSPCKINLLLNVLGRRADGFHELESVMLPVAVFDRLSLTRAGTGIELTCSHPDLPTNSSNLVYRAAEAFREAAGIQDGVRIHLKKRLPLAAGLGGGSANAAVTLLAMNELFGHPLAQEALQSAAAALGSDVPFFLQSQPALATGRGEKITPLDFFPALRGAWIVLIHPGFGIPTAWTYQHLARFPETLNGRPERAKQFVARLEATDLKVVGTELYNSLERPVYDKYPILAIFQEFLRSNGAVGALMSGSGSATFAIVASEAAAAELAAKFKDKFGQNNWVVWVPAQADRAGG